MGKINARKKGNSFELYCIEKMSHLFPEAVSARSESKRLDDLGVDICYTGGYSFQCKAVEKGINPTNTLLSMPDDKKRVLLWKKNRRGTLAMWFYNEDEFDIMIGKTPMTRLHDVCEPNKLTLWLKGGLMITGFENFIKIVENEKKYI